MILIRYIFLYFIIIFPGIFLSDKFNKKIEKTIPIGLISISILIYLFGIINLLQIGVVITCAISIILFLYVLTKNIRNKTIYNLKENITTPAFMFFTVIFFIFSIVTLNRELTNWDQFSYWSITAKDMFYTNRFPLSISEISLYPPVPVTLQYFFMKIIGRYIQGIEIFTTWILGFLMLIPLFDKSNGKKITNFIIGIIILCIPAVFSMLIFYESSYPDALLGILIGYISYTYFFEEDSKFKMLNLIMALTLLTLTKATGFVISIILILTFILYQILNNRKNGELKENLKKIFIFLFIIIVTFATWKVYLNINNNFKSNEPNNTTSLKTITQSFITTVFGVYRENNDVADSNGKLIEKLYNVTEISTPVKISALGVITIYVVIMLIYYNKTDEKVKIRNIIISIFTGLILYICALQLAYITQFSNKEMLAHDGMERYIATYLLGLLYFIIAIILDKCKLENRNYFYILLASVIIMITPLNSLANASITSGIYNINSTLYCNIGRQKAEYILNNIEPNKKVLGICQESKIKLVNLMVRYYMYPEYYKVLDAFNDENELKSIVEEKGYDYIYVISSDEKIDEYLKELLHVQTIKKYELYKIEK